MDSNETRIEGVESDKYIDKINRWFVITPYMAFWTYQMGILNDDHFEII